MINLYNIKYLFIFILYIKIQTYIVKKFISKKKKNIYIKKSSCQLI